MGVLENAWPSIRYLRFLNIELARRHSGGLALISPNARREVKKGMPKSLEGVEIMFKWARTQFRQAKHDIAPR